MKLILSKRNLEENNIISVFEYIRSKIFEKPSAFQRTQKNINLICDFLEYVPENAGERWLFDYMCLIFSRYSGTYNIKRLQLSWILGKKGREYFENRTPEHSYFADIFKKDNGPINPLIKQNKPVLSNDYINLVRSYRNILKCQEMGLYEAKKCIVCRNRKICKTINQ